MNLEAALQLGEQVKALEAENAKLQQAIGLATTMKPDMEMDVEDPVGMMQKVVSENAKLQEQVHRLGQEVQNYCATYRTLLRDQIEWLENIYDNIFPAKHETIKDAANEQITKLREVIDG